MLTDADESVLARLSEELYGDYTWNEITKHFNEETRKEVSASTVHRFCQSRGWHEVCDKVRTVPPCSQAHSDTEYLVHLKAGFGHSFLAHPDICEGRSSFLIPDAFRKVSTNSENELHSEYTKTSILLNTKISATAS